MNRFTRWSATSLVAIAACGGKLGAQVDGGTEARESGAPFDAGTSTPSSDGAPFTTCVEVGGQNGCCGGPSSAHHGSVAYVFEDCHVVSEDCGTRGCGWSTELHMYRCGASGPEPTMRYSCGSTLQTMGECGGLGCAGPGKTSDTFDCGHGGLRCETLAQFCFVTGAFPDDEKDPTLTQCVTAPPACRGMDPCSCVVDHLLTPSWCYELGSNAVYFGPAN